MSSPSDFELPIHPYREQVALEYPLPQAEQHQAELILHFQIDRLAYGVKGGDSRWYCLRTYVNTGLLSEASFFRLIFAKDQYLRNQYRRIRAFTSGSPFTLLPMAMDQDDFRLSIARMLLSEDIFEEDILRTVVADWQLAVLSHLRPEWQQVNVDYGLVADFQPTIATCLQWATQWSTTYPQYIALWVHREEVLLVLVADQRLILANAFPYRSMADMLYYVQAVREELPRPLENIPVMVPTGHLQVRQLEEWPAYGLKLMTYPVPRPNEARLQADDLVTLLSGI